jgi:hypothetical protein
MLQGRTLSKNLMTCVKPKKLLGKKSDSKINAHKINLSSNKKRAKTREFSKVIILQFYVLDSFPNCNLPV